MLTRAIRSIQQMAIFAWKCVSNYFKAIITVLSALSIAALARDEFFPQWSQYHIARILKSNWSWQTWALLILVVALIGFVEGAYRQYLQYASNADGLLVDLGGQRLSPAAAEPVPPVTRYVALCVVLTLAAIWIYGFVVRPDTVTITATVSQTFRVVPKAGSRLLPGVIRYFESQVPSDRTEYPHALKVVVQVSETMQALTLYLECDSIISLVTASVAGSPKTNVIPNDEDSIIIATEDSAVTPEHPIVLMLYSRSLLHLKRVSRQ